MKKVIIVALLAVMFCVGAFAEGGNINWDEIKLPLIEEGAHFYLDPVDGEAFAHEITLNAGAGEDEYTYYGYFLPAGRYLITNEGDSFTQITFYAYGTNITTEGWEEPISGTEHPIVMKPQDEVEITMYSNEYIKLADGDNSIHCEYLGE